MAETVNVGDAVTWPLARLYDFANGTNAEADEVDDEFNTLVNAVNELRTLSNNSFNAVKASAGTAYDVYGITAGDVFTLGHASLTLSLLGSTLSNIPDIADNLLPDASGTRDVGASGTRWNVIYGVSGNYSGGATFLTGGGDQVEITSAGNILLSDGQVNATLNAVSPVLYANQLGTGDLIKLEASAVTKFKVDYQGNAALSGTAPLLSFTETDQVAPAGRYRWVASNGQFRLDRSTSGEFTTVSSDLVVDGSGFNFDSGTLFVDAINNGIVVGGTTLTSGYVAQFNGAVKGTGNVLIAGRGAIGSAASLNTDIALMLNHAHTTSNSPYGLHAVVRQTTLGVSNATGLYAKALADTITITNFFAVQADNPQGDNGGSVTNSYFAHVASAYIQTTVGAAGGASALPAAPTGYLKCYINGAYAVIPYYAAS